MDSFNKINIDFITLRDNILNISGYLRCKNASQGIYGVCNGQKILPESYDYPTRRDEKIFNFEFRVPVSKKPVKFDIKSCDDVGHPIRFRKFCNMSDLSRYYVKDNKIVFYDGSFNVVDFSYFEMFSHEMVELSKIIKKRPDFY